MPPDPSRPCPEERRLKEDARREVFWKFFGTYVSERQWGTVREDYSGDSDVWTSFPHDHARSRAYRWGEDGLFGLTDRFGRLCFSAAFWNGQDGILKERLFGLSGPQGNHGEDVKELYYYLDATPTHSWCRALYKYPQTAFPYDRLDEENARRSRDEKEFELTDTGIFDDGRYFDIFFEYAKASWQDVLIRIRVVNRGPETAPLHVLPTLWFRNTWSWGAIHEECTTRPVIEPDSDSTGLHAQHEVMGNYVLSIDTSDLEVQPVLLFTENETNSERLFDSPNRTPYVKDAFHRWLIHGEADAVNPAQRGSKAAACISLKIAAGEERVLQFRLSHRSSVLKTPFGPGFDQIFATRQAEADAFYAGREVEVKSEADRAITRQAAAGLLWTKQFYNLVQSEWLSGDPDQPAPPPGHATRNAEWSHLFSRDVLTMPDKWEYPYFCSWDLAFHSVAFAHVDPVFAKQQLLVLLREWYLHLNGQIPAYEWNFSDVNPPVHAWAAWRVYRLPWLLGEKDTKFLETVFQKLLLNFTWWVNRKDPDGNNLFAGGFLGLDNIGVFDRSKPLPTGGVLKQADGTAWMAFYCIQMLSMALELAQTDDVYEDMASKFFEHFVRIVHAINDLGGRGLWNEEDGFYYDMLEVDGTHVPLRVRSIVGFMPLLAVTIIPKTYAERCPQFSRRVAWFVRNNPGLVDHVVRLESDGKDSHLLAVPTREHLERILKYLFDEEEFLSPFGIRSVSKCHAEHPYVYHAGSMVYSVDYEPGEGTTGMFGGNSNWRGPVWMPINFLLVEALRTYHRFYGADLMVEFPTRSGNWITLGEAARNLSDRLISLFRPDADGTRPCHGGESRYAEDPAFRDLVLFYEYFHADTGRGCGASHQTGWTALVSDLIHLGDHWDF